MSSETILTELWMFKAYWNQIQSGWGNVYWSLRKTGNCMVKFPGNLFQEIVKSKVMCTYTLHVKEQSRIHNCAIYCTVSIV